MKRMLTYLIIITVLLSVSVSAQNDPIIEAKLNQKVSSLEFRDTNVTEFIRLLARQNALNIVLGTEIQGRVTVSLRDVTVRDVLKTVLNSLGFHYIVDNNIILIKAFDRPIPGDFSTEVFQLKYIDAYDVVQPVTSLLTTKGKVEVVQMVKTDKMESQRSDMLVVSDVIENIGMIADVISQLDQPQHQVTIEVRLIETILGENDQIGFNWPKQLGVKLTGANPPAIITSEEGTQAGLSAYSEIPVSSSSLEWGILTIDELRFVLNVLAEDDDSKLVSNPKVTTLDKKEAFIKIGTSIPIPQVNRGAAGDLITYEEKEVDVSMRVIPRIEPEGKINLLVNPKIQEIIGYTGDNEFPQPITSTREVRTNVTVRTGETIVIGGMVKESKQTQIDKVWLLGDIPILGYLFQDRIEVSSKTDLLIFITPKIIEEK